MDYFVYYSIVFDQEFNFISELSLLPQDWFDHFILFD